MKFELEPFETFVYRIPFYPFQELKELGKGESYDDFLRSFFSRKEIQEALYIASPDFLEEVRRFLKEEDYSVRNEKKMNNFRYSALKYINRICSRPTPFGMFAGCGTGKVENNPTKISPNRLDHFQRHIRMDMAYLDQLKESILEDKERRELFTWFSNNSIYEKGDEIRYVEFHTGKGGRKHTLSKVRKNEFLASIVSLASQGATFQKLLDFLLAEDIDPDSAKEYLHDLIDSRLLLSELEPFVVSNMSYEQQMVDVLLTIPEEDRGSYIEMVLSILRDQIDKCEAMERTCKAQDTYTEIQFSLNELLNKKERFTLQVDAEVISDTSVLSQEDIWNIKKGMNAYFQLVSVSRQNQKLVGFKQKFLEKYETATVRLVDALDSENGLHYGNLSDNQLFSAPIIDDIPVGKERKEFDTFIWDNELHYFLFPKILEARRMGKPVVLSASDLSSFSFDQTKIPPTVIAFIQLFKSDNGPSKVYFKNWGSDSAATILGRFSHLNAELESLVSEISKHEDQCIESHKILAEINHLSDPRIGNITSRRSFRSYEIPYITKSNAKEKGLINVSDLYIRLVNNQFQLIDIKRKKQVIPILSNAHNFNKDTLPVYRFLSDIQNESDRDTLYMNLNLGPITNILDYIPRITYKNYIFRLATWKLFNREIDELRMIPEQDRLAELRSILSKRGIPEQFFITSGDNKLLIDFDKFPYPSYLLLTEELQKNGVCLLEEYPFGEDHESVVQNELGSFNHEIIVPFKNNSRVLENKENSTGIAEVDLCQKKRVFYPGSEWVYFKVYSGIHTRDKIIEKLSHLVQNFREKEYIKKWFFIKYSDDKSHLRVRFLASDTKYVGVIIRHFYDHFRKQIEIGSIQNIVLDSYHREMERYGGDELIEASESLFELDSDWTLHFLDQLAKYKKSENTYWLMALRVTDAYMQAFGLTLKGKETFARMNKDHFSKEFRSSKTQKRNLLLKYRSHKEAIEQIMSGNDCKWVSSNIVDSIARFQEDLSRLVVSEFDHVVDEKRWELLISFIHMFLLRYLPAKNRKHEYFIYAMLEHYYRLRQGQLKAQTASYV